jgi:hypothetical protein
VFNPNYENIERNNSFPLHISHHGVLQNSLSLAYLKKIFVKHIHSYFNPMVNNLTVTFVTALFTTRLVE